MARPSTMSIKILKINPRYFPIIIFFFALATNAFFFDWRTAPQLQPDSQSYIQFAKSILSAKWPDTVSRTPTYPLYLAPFVALNKLKWAAIGQILFAALSMTILYALGSKITKRKRLCLVITLFLGLNLDSAEYNSIILTESISQLLFLASVFLHAVFFKKYANIDQQGQKNNDFSKTFLFSLTAIDALLILARPNLSFIPIVLTAIAWITLRVKGKKITFSFFKRSAFLLLFFILLILSYCWLNRQIYSWFGISRLSSIALNGKLIQYNYIDESNLETDAPKEAKLVLKIKKDIEKNIQPDLIENRSDLLKKYNKGFSLTKWLMNLSNPFEIELIGKLQDKLIKYFFSDRANVDPFSVFNNLAAGSLEAYPVIEKANTYFLSKNKAGFILKSIYLIPKVAMSPPYPTTKIYSNKLMPIISLISLVFRFLFLISFAAISAISIFIFLKTLKKKLTAWIIPLAAIWYLYAVNAFFAYSSYPRLRMPADNLILFTTLYFTFAFILKIFKRFGPPLNFTLKKRDSILKKPVVIFFLLCAFIFPLNALRERKNADFQLMSFFNLDSGSWLEAAREFPNNLGIWISRPLYPFLVFSGEKAVQLLPMQKFIGNFISASFSSQISLEKKKSPTSVGEYLPHLISSLAINFLLYYFTALLFYRSLQIANAQKITAIISSILFASSLIVLTWLDQPMPQIFDYFAISVLFYFYMHFKKKNYQMSDTKVFFASFVAGLFLLSKPLFFIPILGVVLFAALKKWRQLALFFIGVTVPYLAWYFTATKFFNIAWYDHSMDSSYRQMTWLLPALAEFRIGYILKTLSESLKVTVYDIFLAFFTVTPFLFPTKKALKLWRVYRVEILLSLFSILATFFAIKAASFPRIAFFLFPFVFWIAAENIDFFSDKFKKFKLVAIALILLIFLSLNFWLVKLCAFS